MSWKERVVNRIQNSSILDEYSNKVFKLVVLIVPIFFLCGNATMTIMHYLGYYPAVYDVAMWFSNAMDICYMCIAIYLIKHSYGPDGLLIPKNLSIAKIVLMIMVVIQWNLNSYICPFEDFWAYAPLFVIVEAFFFDVRLVSLSTFFIVLSMIISWIVNGENLLPARDEFFYLNLIFRGIGLTFTLLSINIITWFGRVFIIEAVASREKEREMREKSIEYAREARMKSDFLANMSHEIRTPMNAVIGLTEIAMREEMTPGAKDCLTQIQKSGNNLLNIINDILDFSKIDSGKMDIVPERYEPASELYDISNILATRIGEKNLHLFFIVYPQIPHVLFGDIMRIRQILINLINNAIKFTQKGSVGVSVTGENTDSDTVTLTFHIKDTGIGIREEDMEKLFSSFQQVDSRRNRSVEGTGLGLAISQRLVESMGGKIGVDSTYGEGSDFWFSIPQKVLDPNPDMVIRDSDKKRSIFMDDDKEMLRVFEEEMNALGVRMEVIGDINEYKPVSGYRDYLFFEYRKYNEHIRNFLKNKPDILGVILVDVYSDFSPDINNLQILRSPGSTYRLVNLLNDEYEENNLYETQDAFTVNFTAPSAKILVVDDNAINITVVEGLLAPTKINIDSALSGPMAIDKIKEEKYDIVLMDHMMPGMDGVDATKIIRETMFSEDELVIIALSANAIEEAKNMFLEAGMNDFVAKPIDIKDLIAKIRKWLPDEKIKKHMERSDSTEESPVEMAAGSIAHEDKADKKTSEENLSENNSDLGSMNEDFSDEASFESGNSMGDDPLKPFEDIEMLDLNRAVEYLGSPDLLYEIIEEYYDSGQECYDELMKSYDDEDIEDFTIRIHALKSSSRMIGAYELGDMAEALEKAGSDGDMDFIKDNTEETMDMFIELLGSLSPVFEE